MSVHLAIHADLSHIYAVHSFVFRSALLSQLSMHLLDVITQRPFPGATFTHFSL